LDFFDIIPFNLTKRNEVDKKIKYLSTVVAFVGAISIANANEGNHNTKHWGYLGDSSPAHWG